MQANRAASPHFWIADATYFVLMVLNTTSSGEPCCAKKFRIFMLLNRLFAVNHSVYDALQVSKLQRLFGLGGELGHGASTEAPPALVVCVSEDFFAIARN